MKKNGKFRFAAVAVLIIAIACLGIFAGMRMGSRRRAESAAASREQAALADSAKAASAAAADSRAARLAASASAAESREDAQSAETAALSAAEEERRAANRDDAASLMRVSGIAIGNVAEYYGEVNQLLASGETPSSGPTPTPASSGNGYIVCIDPGHQDHGMSDTEPNGPGSSTMKAKLTTGTYGPASGKNEYEVNLEVSLKLRDALQSAGYTVVMTRESNDVEISNVERAEIANNAGANIFVRIHCNGSENTSSHGALCYEPTYSNAYLSENVISESQRLARTLVDAQCAATGQTNLGTISGDDMTGINWAQMPVTIVEMGFMSNPDEDLFLSSDAGQAAIVQGLTNGINSYFGI